MPLTELAVKHLKQKAKTYRVADSNGLCLEVSPAGGKHWRYRYRYQGKGQMLALGKYPAVSLAQARKRRDEARELLESGKHPAREKKMQKLRKAHEGANTFEKLARQFLKVKQEGLTPKYAEQCVARMEQHVFKRIGDLPVNRAEYLLDRKKMMQEWADFIDIQQEGKTR